jgi:hypothetical protein
MTAKQPEALRLAELLTADEWPGHMTLVSYARECVAELRRLHALNAELLAALKCIRPIECHMVGHTKGEFHSHDEPCPVVKRIEDTIAKAEGREA